MSHIFINQQEITTLTVIWARLLLKLVPERMKQQERERREWE